ncbi:tripartite tricarboxylate transporter substrate binding protein [Consotaella salsifontis]|uniref:Putative tricarboxylic transport membrane protein n=1 Tax=Consotaella salsifontis TaxID=1365950 RepID=A0A1T4MR44_9HYPH|nr:tripartite tricarboxylate transporter substrate-binding protein [Consotaella salsifontis]SJZ69264.1 putative tricarboxylic transport membrane protein [Consotaella salsifontis]
MLKVAKYLLPALVAGFAFSASAADYPSRPMEFIAPAGAGGGWDTTIRAVAKVLSDTGLVKVPMPVTNKPGGGGGVNLAYMTQKAKSDTIVSVYSPPLLLINLSGTTPLSYKNTTPLARLISDYEAFAVKADSPYKDLNDVIEALKKDPGSVSIGGTSAAGSMDHLAFVQVAKAAGVNDIKKLNYISYQDGSSLAQLLGGHLDILSTGITELLGQLKSGDIRVLCYTAPKPVAGREGIPTCREAGVPVDFLNWRGLFGTEKMPEAAVKYWRDTLGKMVQTKEWADARAQYGWDDSYLDGPEFEKFLEQSNEEYKGMLSELGMLAAQ